MNRTHPFGKRWKRLLLGLLLSSLAAVTSVVFSTGCSTPDRRPEAKPANLVELTSFWTPYELFLQERPHASLYVEVDAVEGLSPDEEALNRLRSFLGTYCAKPGGIQLVRDSVISREEARGLGAEVLARRFMRGPQNSSNTPCPAYMYVLFFDTALGHSSSAKSAKGRPGADASHRTPVSPHVWLLPYPAMIIVDPHYNGPPNAPKVGRVVGQLLQHEAGHLLGLARNATHTANGHCQDKSCLMFRDYNFTELLLREIWQDSPGTNPIPQTRLCTKCVTDLKAYREQAASEKIRFVGPVLVRAEAGYSVLSLPLRVKVVVGDFEDKDAWEFLEEFRKEKIQSFDEVSVLATGVVKSEARRDSTRLREIVQRARKDPYVGVRKVAEKM